MWEPLPVFSLRAVMTFPSIGKHTSLNVGNRSGQSMGTERTHAHEAIVVPLLIC